MGKNNTNKNEKIEDLLEQKGLKEELLADEFLVPLQDYIIENCIKDFREKFSAENISKNDFEKFIKSRLRLSISSAYMLGKITKNKKI